MNAAHSLGCDCDACWREFRARYADMSESVLREAFDAGTATARKYRAARSGAVLNPKSEETP